MNRHIVSPWILVLAAASSAGCSAARWVEPGPRPVLLTTDIGTEVDDQWALAHLLLASEEGAIDLLGIVTTHAPNLKAPAAESSAAAAREVMGVLKPRRPPPVIAGSSLPLPPSGSPRPSLGTEFILELSKGFSPARRLTVIALGAATDVASALLLDPGAADRIEVKAVAFEGWPRGGDPWNVKNDPVAWRAILASRVPIEIGPVETCLRHLPLDERGAEEKTRGGGAAGELLRSSLLGWLDREEGLCRRTTGRRAWPIWDLIIPAHLLGFTQDQVLPRPRLRDDLGFDLEETSGSIRWITAIDEEELWSDFRDRLRRWAKRMEEDR